MIFALVTWLFHSHLLLFTIRYRTMFFTSWFFTRFLVFSHSDFALLRLLLICRSTFYSRFFDEGMEYHIQLYIHSFGDLLGYFSPAALSSLGILIVVLFFALIRWSFQSPFLSFHKFYGIHYIHYFLLLGFCTSYCWSQNIIHHHISVFSYLFPCL